MKIIVAAATALTLLSGVAMAQSVTEGMVTRQQMLSAPASQEAIKTQAGWVAGRQVNTAQLDTSTNLSPSAAGYPAFSQRQDTGLQSPGANDGMATGPYPNGR